MAYTSNSNSEGFMMENDGLHVFVNNKVLRCGHTTGTCAAAASKAAAMMLLTGQEVMSSEIATPKGVVLDLPVEDITMSDDSVRCAVRKDGGDDIDATHGALVYSEVRRCPEGIAIEGGIGVGRVTRKGLDQPVGNAAINRVPRSMITEAVADVMETCGYNGGLDIVISVPQGLEISLKTFNPRLGIVGGISILGTSGIVEPMSETAIIKTITTEMDMRKENGADVILTVPGNYGKDFADTIGVDSENAVKCSNFIGETLDHACELGTDLLLIGNLGKLVKVAGGIMNTHSRNADCRMEILASYSAMAGADIETVRKVMGCISTDDALDIINGKGLIPKVSELLSERVEYHMNHRTGGAIKTAAIVYSSVYGLLFKTSLADELLSRVKVQQ